MKKSLIVFFVVLVGTTTYRQVGLFTDPSIEAFDHMTIDKFTGRVYIAGVNRLYELSAELDFKTDKIDGTVNNVNKALLIDYTTSNLISCGSATQTCRIHKLHNISDILETDEITVAGHAEASTVAFIGPGLSEVSQVMYIGATHTSQSEVPAVSTRSLNLDTLLRMATPKTKIYVNSLHREQYFIRYVYGFSSKGFSYFLTTQRKSIKSNELESKLVRVCQNDDEYYSYAEVPIYCIGTSQDGRNYTLAQAAYVGKVGCQLAENLNITTNDDVLFTVFSELSDNDILSNSSALCIYPLKSIRRKFTQNIEKCFTGIGQRGLDFMIPNQPCISTKLKLEENFCGLNINTPLGGEEPIQVEPVRRFQTEVTAVTVAVSNESTIAFIGTATGHLKTILIESDNLSTEYEDLVVDKGSRVNSDLHFDPNFEHLYVLTQKTVSKVKVHNCDVYRTYEQCANAGNPHCRWCSLENRCCSQTLSRSNDVGNCINHKTKNYPTITKVMPEQIQVSVTTTLNLMVENLPTISAEFKSTFNIFEKKCVTSANGINNGVSCPTPSSDLLPSVPGKVHLNAKLSISDHNGSDFSMTDFKFFDCSTFSTCTKCVSSSFSCDWCIHHQRCTHNPTDDCKNDILITGINRIVLSYRSGPTFCTAMNATTNEILAPLGSKKLIKIEIHPIYKFMENSRFWCRFNIEGRITSVNARLLRDTVYCNPMHFIANSDKDKVIANFDVVWGARATPLDNPKNISVVIYDCGRMADTHEKCLSLDIKFKCVWCQKYENCMMDDECVSDFKN